MVLHALEEELKKSGCWEILKHPATKAKLGHADIPLPSLKKNSGGRLFDRLLFSKIKHRSPKAAFLVFWMLSWEGNLYRTATLLDNVITRENYRNKNRERAKRIGVSEDHPLLQGYYDYSRVAIVQLYDSKTGKVLWRARKSFGGGGRVDSTGRAQMASRAVRDAQNRKEIAEFVNFFSRTLTEPPGLRKRCINRRRIRKQLKAREKWDPTFKWIPILKKGNAKERAEAAAALGNPEYENAVEPLVAALLDPDLKVRARATSSLGKIGSPKAAKPLVALLGDSNPLIRAVVARALGEIGSERAKTPLQELIRHEKDARVLKAAKVAIQKVEESVKMDMDFIMDDLGIDQPKMN